MPFQEHKIPTLITLEEDQVLDDSPTSKNSAAQDTEPYSRFLLYLKIDSTLAPTDIRFIIQFSNDGGTTWFDLQNDFWGDLRYEDTAVASIVYECLEGPCAGKKMRLRAVATGTNATNYFTYSAYLELYR